MKTSITTGLLIALLIIASVITELAEAGKNKDFIVYFDPATIRKSGNIV